MANLDLRTRFERLARELQRNNRCVEHNKEATYTINKSGDNISTAWNFCCEEQKKLITGKYNTAATKEVADYGSQMLRDAFKGFGK